MTAINQIIGKGGFSKEVAAYLGGYIHYFENEEIQKASLIIPAIIAIGDPHVRKAIATDYPLNYTSQNFGKIYSAQIGEGSIICPNTIITTQVFIGKHVILNLGVTIGHDCVIGDYTTISPAANISGNVTIGACCYIGTNATIREKIFITANTIIGAGAVVVKDITEPGVYVGNPAMKIIR